MRDEPAVRGDGLQGFEAAPQLFGSKSGMDPYFTISPTENLDVPRMVSDSYLSNLFLGADKQVG